MRSGVLLLRIAFLTGAVLDGVESLAMSIPRLFTRMTGASLAQGPSLTYGLAMAVPVMLGWTLLLVWASREPLARRGVALCLIPVLAIYIIVESIVVAQGVAPLSALIPNFVLQTALIGACTVGYLHTAPAAKATAHQEEHEARQWRRSRMGVKPGNSPGSRNDAH